MRASAIQYTASAAARDSATHAPSTSPLLICTTATDRQLRAARTKV
jgi:hypothetical protein